MVTFTEFCSTLTGNFLLGIELRNSLKLSLMLAVGAVNPFTMLSIDNIQDAAR